MNAMKDKSKLDEKMITAFFGTTAAGTDDDIAVFTAPFDCEIISANVVNATTAAADGTDYLTLTLTDKGSAGSGSDAIATITTATVALTAFKTRDMSTISATHGLLSEGDVVSLAKTHANAGVATDCLQVFVTIRRR